MNALEKPSAGISTSPVAASSLVSHTIWSFSGAVCGPIGSNMNQNSVPLLSVISADAFASAGAPACRAQPAASSVTSANVQSGRDGAATSFLDMDPPSRSGSAIHGA